MWALSVRSPQLTPQSVPMVLSLGDRGGEALRRVMCRYNDTYVCQEQKGNHESHRKERLSVVMSFLLFLEFLLKNF